ncbi:serine/threonine-protein phosphatase 1 regulatory subunit 10-like [Saccostrea echinata]|uniref:serine/threonine-protein phosphatase 1 regulatory subunit 10-like n=1 Tax=Saccostrea echinata TaxID=191078 RepID=UPI002A81B200|nr:serine/threonine-protein phosphatase 1 regulatory subunit 10-like [Saccostrea echinata]
MITWLVLTACYLLGTQGQLHGDHGHGHGHDTHGGHGVDPWNVQPLDQGPGVGGAPWDARAVPGRQGPWDGGNAIRPLDQPHQGLNRLRDLVNRGVPNHGGPHGHFPEPVRPDIHSGHPIDYPEPRVPLKPHIDPHLNPRKYGKRPNRHERRLRKNKRKVQKKIRKTIKKHKRRQRKLKNKALRKHRRNQRRKQRAHRRYGKY